ncbi:S-layer homology domain-containing protein [Paenibacillus daejeonensis]|uniref:S-layer homology domain-containing protein n=1 Tax=Paenibacillus daejeonensis TaxID=135193 RepID=UPI000361E841|nr:S-layer homology domain-containing protein [Paenibacillus daejeonensis]
MKTIKQKSLMVMLCLALLLEGWAIGGAASATEVEAGPLSAATTYYVSQSTGDDSYDGLAPEWDGTHGPWQTLAKASTVTYTPGDSLQLKRGDAWNEQLTMRGSGTESEPVIVTGYGAGNRPYIYRNNGVDDEAIRIDNADGYRIEGLELANARRGIRIIANGNDKPRFEHYWIEDNYFRNITNPFGSLPGEEGTAIDLVTVPGNMPVFANLTIKNNIFRRTEISYIMWSDGIAPRQENVLFEGSTFLENGRNQVFQWSGENIDLRNNLFYYNYPWKYFGVGLTSVLTEHLSGAPGVYNEVDGNEFGWSGTYPGDHDGTAYDFEKSGDYIHFTNNFVHDSYRYGVMFMGGQTFNHLVVADNLFKDNTLGTKDQPYNIWLRADNTGSGEFTNNQFYSDSGVTGFFQKPSSFTYTNNTDPATTPGFVAMPLVTELAAPTPQSRTYTFESATWGAELRYTLDGSVPDSSSILYTGPITVSDKSAVVNVKAFVAGMHPSKTNAVLVDLRETEEGEGPAHWWKLDETAGSTAADTVGGADGTVTNGTWTTGIMNGALAFDGTSGGVDVNDAALAVIEDDFTMAFWVKPQGEITLPPEAGDGISGDQGQRYAIAPSYRGGGVDSTHAGVGVSVGTNGIAVVEHSDVYLPALLVDGGISLDSDKWTHIAIVYKDKQPWLYVNGIFRKAGHRSTKIVHPSGDIGGSGLGRYTGSIDDVRIYDRQLAIQEVQTLSHFAHEPELPEYVSQWQVFNSPLDGGLYPTGFGLEADAITFSGEGYYTITEGEVESANGAVFTPSINPEHYSVVFTPQQIAGNQAADDDSWLALALLDAPRYFNVLKPEQARGLVVLLRNSNNQLRLEPYKLVDAGFLAQPALTLGTAATGQTYELRLAESGGEWKLMVDDTEFTGDYTDIVSLLSSDPAYAMVGLSDKDGGENRIAIHTVNGQQAYGTPSYPEWRDGYLSVSGITDTEVTLDWGGAVDREGVDGYRIYRDGTDVAEVEGDTSQYVVTGLNPATDYTFRIEARNAANGWSVGGPTAQVTTDYALPEDLSFAADWQLFTGKANGEDVPTEVRLGHNGIVFMGSGYYTVANQAVVPSNGAVFTEPVDVNQFKVRFTPERIAGSLSRGDDSWVAISLMSSPDYFDVLDPASGEGLVVLLRDTDGQLTVQPHLLTTGAGFQAMPELTLDAPVRQQHELQLTAVDGVWRLGVNGMLLPGDYSYLVDTVLGEQAYVQIGLSDKQHLQNRIRVHTVNAAPAHVPGWEQRAMQPFWQGKTMVDESLLMVAGDNGLPEADLLFEPTEILSVRSATLDKTYVEGVDWTYADGRLRLLPGSTIPFMTEAQLYPEQVVPGESVDRRGGGAVLLREGSYFHERQIVVTYRHAGGAWAGPVPELQSERLPVTLGKLQDGEPLKLLVLGDSIATGANASGVTNASPYLPDWAELLKRGLQAHYDADINLINRSKGGMTSMWGMEEAEVAAGEAPDLVIVAFGMNDGVGSDELYAPALFRSYIATIMDHFRAANNEVEFILVGTTLANPETYFDGKQPLYMAELDALAEDGAGIATADMTGVHAELLTHKAFRDMTGNHVNHPNDFLVRWYAQMLSGLLIPTAPEEGPGGGDGGTGGGDGNGSAGSGSTGNSSGGDGSSGSPSTGNGSGGLTEATEEVAFRLLGAQERSQLLSRAVLSGSVKLQLAGEMVEVTEAELAGEAVYELMLRMEQSSGHVELTGIYYWDEAHASWTYVRSFRNLEEGSIRGNINKPGIYGVLVYDRTFADVPATHWAGEAIKVLSAAQLIQGVDALHFEPSRQISRAEFTTLLVRLLNLEPGQPGPFSDVMTGVWYEAAAAAAYEAGIVKGNDKQEFMPHQIITREEMATMLVRAAERGSLPLQAAAMEEPSALTGYTDAEAIAAWAHQAVATVTAAGLMQGLDNGKFGPDEGATRAQAATVIRRLDGMLRALEMQTVNNVATR